jgi:hypothetical protein
VGNFLLLFFEGERGAFGCEGLAQALAGGVAPIGVELSLLLKHGVQCPWRWMGFARTLLDTIAKRKSSHLERVCGCDGHYTRVGINQI